MNGLLHKYIYYTLTMSKAKRFKHGRQWQGKTKMAAWQRQGKTAW